MKRIKSRIKFICGLVLVILGVFGLCGMFYPSQSRFNTLLSIEIIAFGVAMFLNSISYEDANYDQKSPPNERSKYIRMRAEAQSFNITTCFLALFPQFFRLFHNANGTQGELNMYITVSFYGILSVSWLIHATLLIFYEQNM